MQLKPVLRYWSILKYTEVYWGILRCTEVYWGVLRCTEVYWGITGIYWYTEVYWGIHWYIGIYWGSKSAIRHLITNYCPIINSNLHNLINSLLSVGKSRAVSTHAHTLLEVGGKFLGPQGARTVRAHTVNTLLQRRWTVAKDIETFHIHNIWVEEKEMVQGDKEKWMEGGRGDGGGGGGRRGREEKDWFEGWGSEGVKD